MKKNNGFTLAEVLITLTIIGVIAAMTIPALNQNTQYAKAGPALMKAINTLQNALSLGMAEKGLRNLNNYTWVKDIFEENGPLYTTMDFYDPISVYSNYYKFDGSRLTNNLSRSNQLIYTTKDGIDFLLPNNGNVYVIATGNKAIKYGKYYFDVFVDIDGHQKGKNRAGIDTFHLLVDTQGIVIPFGGYEYLEYTGTSQKSSSFWEKSCNSTTVSNGLACTGSIVDNGGKVIYKNVKK